jgi:hypothetical protein
MSLFPWVYEERRWRGLSFFQWAIESKELPEDFRPTSIDPGWQESLIDLVTVLRLVDINQEKIVDLINRQTEETMSREKYEEIVGQCLRLRDASSYLRRHISEICDRANQSTDVILHTVDKKMRP